MAIKELLVGNSTTNCVIKCEALAAASTTGKYVTGDGASIELTQVENLSGKGVSILARAWDVNGAPIGFGRDGSIEWERFRIYNPPIMVPDVDNFKEDPLEALRQVIAHNVKLVGKPGANVTPGKIGNTTSTFFATLNDAYITNTAVDTWANVRNAATGTGIDTTSSYGALAAGIQTPAGTMLIRRSIFVYDTSSIPDSDTIDSATNSHYIIDSSSSDNDGDDWINIYLATPADPAVLVTGDYDQVGEVAQATQIDITSIATGAYKDWTLNATGLGNISKTGNTILGAREGHDVLNSEVLTDASGNIVNSRHADTAGTTQDPKLVVVHAAVTTPKMFLVF